MEFWAHSDPWQLLSEHLRHVAKLSRLLAESAAPEQKHFHDLAEWCGLLHDFGKYTDCFQKMIRDGQGRCQHAIHGAALAYWPGAGGEAGLGAVHLAFAIAGHHAGMPDRSDLHSRAGKFRQEAAAVLERAKADSPEIARLFGSPPPKLLNLGPGFDLLTRMLASCLVDADRLDTAGRSPTQSPLDAAVLSERLLRHVANLAARSPDGVVKQARQEVLESCLAAAGHPERILTLSVPTGGGKTLAAMAFALKRAALYPDRYRRVIVVIPYLSIIEQNAEVYASIFGPDAILEHHSGSFDRLKLSKAKDEVQGNEYFAVEAPGEESYESPRLRSETENWDAPIIVTTSVRFFESLFSNHPSDLRRIHNIARSIVILDEVQVLPRPLLSPLLSMIDELAANWGCTFLLSTATKPAFEKSKESPPKDPRWPQGKAREIVDDPETLYKKLKRVEIDWRLKERLDWPELAQLLSKEEQVLCVVNLRDHASALYDQLAQIVSQGSALFHLSTRMCPAHRLKVIEEIRTRLKSGKPCRVVSTQLIEAGVDLDFPMVYRALGPMDSIMQVAGRADREGLLTAKAGRPAGKLVVFKPVDHRVPPNEYKHATDITEAEATIRNIRITDRDALENFFERFYGEGDLGDYLQEMRFPRGAYPKEPLPRFRTLSDEFEMISSRTQDVLVPFGDGKFLLDELYRIGQLTADLRRRLQRYVVGLQPWEFQSARQLGCVTELRAESSIWIAGDPHYDPVKGVVLMSGNTFLNV